MKPTKAIKSIRAQRRVSECSGHCIPAIKGKLSAIADVGGGSVLRQLCGGELLLMAVSNSRTAASSISAFTLSTPLSICFIDRIGRFR